MESPESYERSEWCLYGEPSLLGDATERSEFPATEGSFCSFPERSEGNFWV